MQEFVEFTLGGVSDGVIYAAIGLSLVLIWRATRVLNYAQGAMAMFTSYIALIVINATGNYWLGFVVALAAGLVIGGAVERVVIRPTAGKPHLNTVIVTIGLLILVEGVAGMIYGSKNRSFPTPYSIVGAKIGSFDLGQGSSPSAIFTAVAVLAAAGLLAVLFRYTSVGLRMRASAFSGTVAQLMGVRVGRITTFGWALAGFIGALAGMLVTPQTFLYPNSMDSIFVLGFTAAVIGGLDSPVGAIVGGLILGVLLNYVTGYVGSNLPELAGLALLILVLMFRPSGLFASTATRQV
jgi:branched-chain amino acid transport system permease protein